MLYKTFNAVKTAIDDSNFKLASSYLSQLEKENLAPKAKQLHQFFAKRLPNSIDNRSLEQNFNQLSLFDHNSDILPGISIVSCCMNRNENLVKSLKTWLDLDVDEIIIVDWSSKTPVSESIQHFSDTRIKVLRVENEDKWILTYGFNVGIRFASYSKIYKFDADISVQPNFLELNNFTKGQFVRGFWKLAIDEGLDSQVYVNGSFGAYKEDLKEIGYYNELIRTYGWDDSDLYERLASQRGLQTKFLAFNSLVHLEQKEEERTMHQKIINEDFLGTIKSTEFNNHRNKFIGRNTDYWNINRLQNYSIERVDSALYQLQRVSKSIEILPHIIEDAENYASLHYLWHRKPNIISRAQNQISLAKFIFKEYENRINFAITEKIITEKIYFFTDKSSNYADFINNKLQIAQAAQHNVYTVTLGDSFSHKRIGEYGQYVEMLIVPIDMAKELIHIQNNLGFNCHIDLLIETPYQEFISIFNTLHRPVVYVDAQHGLGNRLRAIGSAASIAKSIGREIIVVWQADHHCECEFSDLFDYDGKVITQAFVNDAYQYMDVFNYMEIEDGARKDAEILINEEKDLYLRAAYTFVHEASHWEAENEFIKTLTPSKQVLDLIEPFNVSGHIAAHIRMEAGAGLDHNTYDSVENWTQEGHDQLHFWREKSHYSAFIKRIDQLIEQDSSLKLFVATDLQETYDIFQQYYGERLSYLKRDVFDRSKEQIIYALADVLLLSRCQKLLGSTWSSFSEAAMRLSDTYSEIEMSGRNF
jgi:hypothetical protein